MAMQAWAAERPETYSSTSKWKHTKHSKGKETMSISISPSPFQKPHSAAKKKSPLHSESRSESKLPMGRKTANSFASAEKDFPMSMDKDTAISWFASRWKHP